MQRWFSTLFLTATALGFVASTNADPANHPGRVASADRLTVADAVSAADARQVRLVIESQLKALAADDAKTAFSFAAPNVRQMFGTPDDFIEMVRTGYPVVYHPASVAFLKPERVADGIVQAVHLTDGDGTLYLALYHLERQKDKTWQISGCEVMRSEGRIA